jgi:hypothetical protein
MTRRISLRAVCFGLALSASAILAAIAGCSSDSDAGCSTDPFQCGSGTTCTVSACPCTTSTCTSSNCVPQFACLPSTSALAGASCTAELGKASCSDGLTCFITDGQGTCVPYCDAANACPSGLFCVPKTVELGPSPPVIYVCLASTDAGLPESDGSMTGPGIDSGPTPDTGKSDGSGPILTDTGLPR